MYTTSMKVDVTSRVKSVGGRRKALLLDVDGVLSPKVRDDSPVVSNIVSHISKTTGLQHVRAAAVNDELYKNYGHTWLGLRERYADKYKLSLEEFNHEIYNSYALQTKLRITDEHIIEVQRLLMNAKFYETYTCTFSNAPRVWCEKVLTALGVLDALPIFELTDSVKPQYSAYESITDHLSDKDRKIETIVLCDDSLVNVNTVLVPNNGWLPVLYGHDSQKFVAEGGVCVRSISELNAFLW